MYRVWDHLMLTSSQRENHAEAAVGAEVMKRSSTARRDPLYASLGHMRHANALARLYRPTESLRAMSLAEKALGRAGYEMLLPTSGSRRTTKTLAVTRQVIEATGTKAPEAVSWIEESRRWI